MKKLATIVLILWSALVCAAFAPFYVPAINIVSGASTPPTGNLVSPLLLGLNSNNGLVYSTVSTSYSQGTSNQRNKSVFPVAGTLSDFYYSPYYRTQMNIYKNNSLMGTCNPLSGVSAEATLCAISPFDVAIGDEVHYELTCWTSECELIDGLGIGVKFTSAEGQYQPLFSTIYGAPTTYSSINSLFATNSTENLVSNVVPTDGTIGNLYVKLQSSVTAGTVTLVKNGVDTALTCSLFVTATCSDTSNTVSIAAGDTISLKGVGIGNDYNQASMTWQPSTPGEAIVLSRYNANVANSTTYCYANSSYCQTTQSYSRYAIPIPFVGVLKKFNSNTVTAPGGSASRDFNVVKGSKFANIGYFTSNVGCTITGSNNTCQSSSSTQVSPYYPPYVIITPTSSPANTRIRYSYVITEGASCGGLDEDTNIYIGKLNVVPDCTRQNIINTLITSLKSTGVWTKLSNAYLLACGNEDDCLIGLKNSSYTLNKNGSLTFTTDRGFTGNGSNAYLSTSVDINALSGYTQNSAHFGFWSRTASSSNSVDAGWVSNSNSFITTYNTSGNIEGKLNTANAAISVSNSNSSGAGFIVANRSASTAQQIYINGSSAGSNTSSSSTLSATPATFLRSASSYSSRQLAFATIGSSLTATEQVDFHTAVQTYLTAIGAYP